MIPSAVKSKSGIKIFHKVKKITIQNMLLIILHCSISRKRVQTFENALFYDAFCYFFIIL